MEPEGYRCRSSRYIESGQSAVPSSVLFAAGLLGNVLALLLLGQHRRRSRSPGGRPPRVSAFYVLVSGLAVTDLLGKCLISPIVLAAYAYNRSLSELGPGGRGEDQPGVLCQLFAFLMAFFGLAPTLLLLAMALECWLSLGHPYFYRRHLTRRLGAALGPAAAGLCALFCALPLLGFGAPMQYCPGTWCFIRMAGGGPRQLGFPVLYASLMGLLVLAIVACNVSSMRHLYGMARRQPRRGPPPAAAPRMEELDHLVRAYMGAFAADFNENADLSALRFLSVNSIVDPWVFIIFRTSVFRTFVRRVCRRLSSRRASLKGSSPPGDGQ
ncbi:PD2R protein, partial [Tichodroma muraria]|nr:PD2R protein [Tichodroma muraria]